jgi:ATP phosphoribosyltransferase
MKSKYDRAIAIASRKTREGSTLNINDLKIIKTMFDIQDLANEEMLEERDKKLAATIVEALKPIIRDIVREVVQEEIKEIKICLDKHEARIVKLESEVDKIKDTLKIA